MFLSKTFAVWIKLVGIYIYKLELNKYNFNVSPYIFQFNN